MRKLLAVMLVLGMILSGCTQNTPPTSPVSETVQQTILETVPETIPETIPAPVPPTEPEPEPEPVAEQIVGGYKVVINGTDFSPYLADDNHYSKRNIRPGDKLLASSEESFASLYIEWDVLPGVYEIRWEGGSMTCGREGFLHDYIRLPEAVQDVEFVFDQDITCTLCDILIFTAGMAPEGIQDWMEPCEEADILVFPTHSDDDALFFGALMSYYAVERELKVQTAFMVEHYWYPERSHERLNGLWEMGIRYYPILHTAPDTATHDMGEAMAYYANSDIPGWQIEQIRRFEPLVVVGHDLGGEYGNGGHKVNAHYLIQTVELAADPEQHPESAARYGTWDTPKLYLHLYEENRMTLDVNTPMENDPRGRTPFQAAEDAYGWHYSQHGLSYRVRQDESVHDCRLFGLYRTLVGYDTTADVMENIAVQDWRQ